LDFWHGSHHLSLALGELNLSDEKRQCEYQELREKLRTGCWQEVLERLQELDLAQVQVGGARRESGFDGEFDFQ
jgi:hypothetical protein